MVDSISRLPGVIDPAAGFALQACRRSGAAVKPGVPVVELLSAAPVLPVELFPDMELSGTAAASSRDAAADNETPAAGMTQNLRMGTTPGGDEIYGATAGSELRLCIASKPFGLYNQCTQPAAS